MKKVIIALALILVITLTFAQSNPSDVSERLVSALCSFYKLLINILPLIVIGVIALAAVVFVIGTIFGAETRSRANVWATNMVIYTIIGILVIIGVPWFLGQLEPSLNLENVCK